MKKIAYILAGGMGSRFECNVPKQFVKIDQKMLLEYTMDIFQQHELIDEIVLVANVFENDITLETMQTKYPKLKEIVPGGKTRGLSIVNAANSISENQEAYIIIHDACRPFVAPEVIAQGIWALNKRELAKTVFKPQDDILLEDKKVAARSEYMILSSPDFIRLSLLKKLVAHDLFGLSCVFTAALQYNPDLDFEYIFSNRRNIKITFPEDLAVATLYLKEDTAD
ncbi:MAG: 2-C-methyl-D-erythritol 4-phosphate cytidylyltransferase [Alphaproteobacteria bacterium]|nr:2-C-methyl-D-erythritol 4-phosphate cytidylyltransferase [Alphaproteobacteria bacterium]